MFEVKISFPGGDPGQTLTREQILAAAPNADIPWLVSVGTLKPLGGAMATVRGTALSPEEWQTECERLGDLVQERGEELDLAKLRVTELESQLDAGGQVNARLESLNRSLADRVASQSEILSRLAEGGSVNLIVHTDFDGGKAGEIIAPTSVAARLVQLLNDGTVGWTEKPIPVTEKPAEPLSAPDETQPVAEPPVEPAAAPDHKPAKSAKGKK